MASLYQCLLEAGLDQYYSILCSNGFTTCKSLLSLTYDDCSSIGIKTDFERHKFHDLISIIRSFLGDSSCEEEIELSSTDNTSTNRKREHDLIYFNRNQSSGKTDDLDVFIAPHLEECRKVKVDSFLLDEPSSKFSSDDLLTPTSDTPMEYVQNCIGYNYGLPKKRIASKSCLSIKLIDEPRIKVCVRKRPLVKREIKANDRDVIVFPKNNVIHVKETKVTVDLTPYTLLHEFGFDEVFAETSTNETVYLKTVKPLLERIFQGAKAMCFAFGQTGAGKTYTMLGNRTTPGLYLLAATDIFNQIKSHPMYVDTTVWVSSFEIYCGQLFDLLNKRNRLHAREDGSQRVCIAGLTETMVLDVQSIMKVLEYGNTIRRKGSTGVNVDSSRSHAVFQLELKNTKNRPIGKISFIDLAGSERASDVTDSDKQTRIEGAEINQSLLALKECIRSIDQDTKHTPFRQSKLTHILKDSFMGNSLTCMIANISPVQSACENTLNTLRYASRVKEIKQSSYPGNVENGATSPTQHVRSRTMFQPSRVLSTSTPNRSHSVRKPSSVHNILSSDSPVRGHIPKFRRHRLKSHHSLEVRFIDSSSSSSPCSSDKSDSCNLSLRDEPKETTNSISKSHGDSSCDINANNWMNGKNAKSDDSGTPQNLFVKSNRRTFTADHISPIFTEQILDCGPEMVKKFGDLPRVQDELLFGSGNSKTSDDIGSEPRAEDDNFSLNRSIPVEQNDLSIRSSDNGCLAKMSPKLYDYRDSGANCALSRNLTPSSDHEKSKSDFTGILSRSHLSSQVSHSVQIANQRKADVFKSKQLNNSDCRSQSSSFPNNFRQMRGKDVNFSDNLSVNNSNAHINQKYALLSPLPSDIIAARQHMVMAHEEQLAKTTSLCKQEMKLLLAIKGDKDVKKFNEYVEKVDRVMQVKLQQIQLMQNMLDDFRKVTR